jgi:hypothetical protein
MKVESVAYLSMQTSQKEDFPVINTDEIKSILYLGIRGDIKLDTGKKHTIDKYA